MSRPTVSIKNLDTKIIERPTMKNAADGRLSLPVEKIETVEVKVTYTIDDLLTMTVNEIKPIVDKLPDTIYNDLQQKFNTLSNVAIFSRNVTWQKNINDLLVICKVLQFKPAKRHSQR